MRTRDRTAGFTLIEIMIVVSLIAIIAAIAIPNLLAGRIAANEAAVTTTLRTIANAESQFKAALHVDANGDGVGEYGRLLELAGQDTLRGSTIKLAPPLLSASFSRPDNSGFRQRTGYIYALYLPDAAGTGLPEVTASLKSYDAVLCSNSYSVAAWPAQVGATGNASFFVNQQGQVIKSTTARYSGLSNPPPAGAGLISSNPNLITSNSLATNATAADGNYWTSVQ